MSAATSVQDELAPRQAVPSKQRKREMVFDRGHVHEGRSEVGWDSQQNPCVSAAVPGRQMWKPQPPPMPLPREEVLLAVANIRALTPPPCEEQWRRQEEAAGASTDASGMDANENNFYSLLGSSTSATTDEIQQNYRQKLMELSRKNIADPGAAAVSRDNRRWVDQAFTVLSSANLRRAHDAKLGKCKIEAFSEEQGQNRHDP